MQFEPIQIIFYLNKGLKQGLIHYNLDDNLNRLNKNNMHNFLVGLCRCVERGKSLSKVKLRLLL